MIKKEIKLNYGITLQKLNKKRKGYPIRKGKIRILYSIEKELDSIFVQKIGWRKDSTYKK